MSLANDVYYADPRELRADQDREAREAKLLRMLKTEEEEAHGYATSEAQEQQIESLHRYYGHAYGDEEDGRSQVTTRELFEVIEWQRNDYARVFASGGNVLTVEANSPEDDRYAKDAADYLAWCFFSDNPGFELLDDFAFDGLLQRRGYLAVYWRDKEYRAPQTLTGLNIEQVQMLMADPMVEIIGQDFDNESEAGGITLMVRRTKSPARAAIESIAPEDMRFAGRTVDLDSARYVGRVQRMLRGEAMRLWPEKAEELDQYSGPGANDTRRSEDVRSVRFHDDSNDWTVTSADRASAELEVLEEYLRVDLDEDGYPELIRSYRVGDLLLEESEVEENPFASWTPIRIPHRFLGLSMHDVVADLQRQSTVITRAGLDALYQSVINREAYDATKVDATALAATYAGAKIPVQGSPGDAILPLTGGLNTATTAWEALEVLKQRLEDRTGATRQTRGLDSEQLNKEHSGKALGMLQINADARKEMVARNLGNGLAQMFAKLYRLVCRNQNEARAVKIGGKWAQFDPRTWNSDLKLSVYSGGMNREHSLMGLQLIGQEQAQVIQLLGPMNPNVTPQNRYRYQEELCRLSGWRNADPFFSEVPDDWQPPPQEDPAMAKVKVEAEAKKAQMQLEGQKAQAQMQLQSQKDASAIQSEREKAMLDEQLARDKAQAEIDLANAKAQAEFDLAKAKMEMELTLAREKMAMELELERERIASQERVGKAKAASDDDTALPKNRPGGSLSE